MNFTKQPVQEETIDYPDSYTSFFVRYMATDKLGRIANAWQAWAEIEPEGAAFKKCIELAHLFSLAVDYPKTGGALISMSIDLEPDQFPDFMENRRKPFFESKTFLGDTYRYCKEKLKYFAQGKIRNLIIDKDLINYPGTDPNIQLTCTS